MEFSGVYIDVSASYPVLFQPWTLKMYNFIFKSRRGRNLLGRENKIKVTAWQLIKCLNWRIQQTNWIVINECSWKKSRLYQTVRNTTAITTFKEKTSNYLHQQDGEMNMKREINLLRKNSHDPSSPFTMSYFFLTKRNTISVRPFHKII